VAIVAKAAKGTKVQSRHLPLHVHRKPSAKARAAIRLCTVELLNNEGYNYCEIVELIRQDTIDLALINVKGVQKTAAARLGISRDHLRNYRRRGQGVL
jgi:DNA-binding NtrC family response regulator